jgi:hypothetical protein
MFNIDSFTLYSGVDIPLPKSNLILHQPTLKEIGLVGEDVFFKGTNGILYTGDLFKKKDNSNSKVLNNFEILMSIIKSNDAPIKEYRDSILAVLGLLFPYYEMQIEEKKISFIPTADGWIQGSLAPINYADFADAVKFVIGVGESQQNKYNPGGKAAAALVKKFEEGRKKAQETKEKTEGSLFDLYISILAVGEHKSVIDLLNYTVYQFLDEFHRYELKLSFDHYMKAKLAGAKEIEEPEDWMKNIHL